MTWRIRLLGTLSVERDGTPIALDGLRQRERELLELLAIRHGQVVSKEQLAETLFGHLDPEHARANVRVAASRLRSALGEETLIESLEGGYRLSGDIALDVEDFERRAEGGRSALAEGNFDSARAELESALELYRGDLTATQADAESFAPLRSRLRARRLDAVDDLADALVALSRPRDAVTALERALELEGTRESTYRRLMTAHYAAGEQDAALHAYERCRKALDEELGVDPLPETMTLHERILRRQPIAVRGAQPAVPTARPSPFVGREAERIVIESAIARAAVGGIFVLVVGEPGAGKTRLVEELLRSRSDVSVLATRCFELERDLPFQPLRDALGDRAPAPAAAVAETSPEHRRASLIEASAKAILAFGRGRPLVWWVDDIQWADRSTLDVLHFIARRAALERVVIIAAGHQEELPPEHPVTRLLTDLRREGRADRVALMPFTADDVAALARAGGLSAAHAATIHARSGGNAFFITELLMATRRGSSLLPETARDAVLARARSLPAEIRRALDAAAILGGRFRAREVAVVAELDDGTATHALGALESQGLLRPLPHGELELVHQLVREAVYADMPAAERSALHKRAIDAVDGVRGAAGASLVCYHAELAGDADCAFACAITAGEQALADQAGAEALASFERALRQPADTESRRRCLTLRAEAKRQLGLHHEAQADLAEADAIR